MKILVYGINFFPELTGTGKYTGEMVEWLTNDGNDVRVITAPPYYPEWKVHDSYQSWCYKVESIFGARVYRSPLYVPKHLSTIKRLVHLNSFALSSFIPLIKQVHWQPEIIICIAPTLFCVPGAVFLAKLTKSKLILHIQDYEVDAMLGLGMAKKGFFANVGKAFEKKCLNSVDYISTISKSMMDKALAKGVDQNRILFFPNWSELERFHEVDPLLVCEVKRNLNLPDNKKIILYAGNIGEKQGLESVIDVAVKLKNKDLIFLIVGQGAGRAKLIKLAQERKLENVLFRPLQIYEHLPALLKLADCHLVIQRKGAADSVLPSKLTNILAVGGNAIITASEDTELGQLCINNPGIAVLVDSESSDKLLHGIEIALNLPAENVIAKRYAYKSLNKSLIIKKFMQDIKG